MKQYLKKTGVEGGDKVVCILRNCEGYLRRGIERRGWHENKLLTSNLFDVKFDTQDSDYGSVKGH